MMRPHSISIAPLLLIGTLITTAGCGRASALTEIQKIRSGSLDVVLLSARDGLRHGKDDFVIEFRSTADGKLVDVGNVKATANMPMAGTPMFGTLDVQRTGVGGRYAANAEFPMAGTWRLAIEWDGPAGKGSSVFSGTVK